MAIAIIVMSVVWASSLHYVYGLFALLVLLSVTADIVFPTTFELSPEGVKISNPFKRVYRPYPHFSGAYASPGYVYLKYQSKIRILRRSRSICLSCPLNQEAVKAVLEAHLAFHDETVHT